MLNLYLNSSHHDPCIQHHTCSYQAIPNTLIHHHSNSCSQQLHMCLSLNQHPLDKYRQNQSNSLQRRYKHSHRSTQSCLHKYFHLYSMLYSQQLYRIQQGRWSLCPNNRILASGSLSHRHNLVDFQHSNRQYSSFGIQLPCMSQEQ